MPVTENTCTTRDTNGHDQPKSSVTPYRNERSRLSEMAGHALPKSPVTIDRNTHPGLRPEFYRTLLASEIYILVPRRPDRTRFVPAGSELLVIEWLRPDGVYIVPFFTSLNTLRKGAPDATSAAPFMVRELFTVLPDRPMHLNPHCEFGREFAPIEIQMLLSQGMIGRADKFSQEEYRHTVVDAVMDPPDETISALITLYSRTPMVEAAYLVRVSRPSSDMPSTLLIALELDAIGEESEIVLSSSAIIGDTYRGEELVDLAFIKHNPVMWDEVRRLARPFYDRSWGGRLSTTESGGRA